MRARVWRKFGEQLLSPAEIAEISCDCHAHQSRSHTHHRIAAHQQRYSGSISMAIPNKKRIEIAILSIVVVSVTFVANYQNFRRSVLFVLANDRVVQQRSSSTSPSSKTTSSSTTSSTGIMSVRSYEDYTKEDYKAFIFATHAEHGLLLLHCTRKKNKPPHYQVPGGHVDVEDFENAMSRSTNHGTDLLIQACKIGAARELFEETGIDVRSALERYAT